MASCNKTFLLLVISTLIIYTQQQLKDPAFMAALAVNQTECAKEIGLDLPYVQNIWKLNKFPNDDKLKCYFKCMSLKLGIINAAGDTVDDILKTIETEFTDEATDREIIKECGAIKGTDLCDTAYKLMGCIKAAELE